MVGLCFFFQVLPEKIQVETNEITLSSTTTSSTTSTTVRTTITSTPPPPPPTTTLSPQIEENTAQTFNTNANQTLDNENVEVKTLEVDSLVRLNVIN